MELLIVKFRGKQNNSAPGVYGNLQPKNGIRASAAPVFYHPIAWRMLYSVWLARDWLSV